MRLGPRRGGEEKPDRGDNADARVGRRGKAGNAPPADGRDAARAGPDRTKALSVLAGSRACDTKKRVRHSCA